MTEVPWVPSPLDKQWSPVTESLYGSRATSFRQRGAAGGARVAASFAPTVTAALVNSGVKPSLAASFALTPRIASFRGGIQQHQQQQQQAPSSLQQLDHLLNQFVSQVEVAQVSKENEFSDKLDLAAELIVAAFVSEQQSEDSLAYFPSQVVEATTTTSGNSNSSGSISQSTSADTKRTLTEKQMSTLLGRVLSTLLTAPVRHDSVASLKTQKDGAETESSTPLLAKKTTFQSSNNSNLGSVASSTLSPPNSYLKHNRSGTSFTAPEWASPMPYSLIPSTSFRNKKISFRHTQQLAVQDLPLDDGLRQVNQLLLLMQLGEGSQGVVYLAVDTNTNECKAVKEIVKPIGNPASLRAKVEARRQRRRLMQEISVMKRCRHPNLVTLYEVIDDPDATSVYLVMKFVEHGPLFSIEGTGAASKTFDLNLVIRFAAQLCSALEYLHARRIVHCDIKGENVLLGQDDVVYLTDFGISRLFPASESNTSSSSHNRPSSVTPATSVTPTSAGRSGATSVAGGSPISRNLGDSVGSIAAASARFLDKALGGTILFRSPESLAPSAGSLPDSPQACNSLSTEGSDNIPGAKATAAAKSLSNDKLEDFKRGDVWALGLTIYAMLCGRMPWNLALLSSGELFDEICSTDPIEIPADVVTTDEATTTTSSFGKVAGGGGGSTTKVPESVRRALGKMLEKNPEKRSSARESNELWREAYEETQRAEQEAAFKDAENLALQFANDDDDDFEEMGEDTLNRFSRFPKERRSTLAAVDPDMLVPRSSSPTVDEQKAHPKLDSHLLDSRSPPYVPITPNRYASSNASQQSSFHRRKNESPERTPPSSSSAPQPLYNNNNHHTSSHHHPYSRPHVGSYVLGGDDSLGNTVNSDDVHNSTLSPDEAAAVLTLPSGPSLLSRTSSASELPDGVRKDSSMFRANESGTTMPYDRDCSSGYGSSSVASDPAKSPYERVGSGSLPLSSTGSMKMITPSPPKMALDESDNSTQFKRSIRSTTVVFNDDATGSNDGEVG